MISVRKSVLCLFFFGLFVVEIERETSFIFQWGPTFSLWVGFLLSLGFFHWRWRNFPPLLFFSLCCFFMGSSKGKWPLLREQRMDQRNGNMLKFDPVSLNLKQYLYLCLWLLYRFGVFFGRNKQWWDLYAPPLSEARMFWWLYRSPQKVESPSWPTVLWLQGGPVNLSFFAFNF